MVSPLPSPPALPASFILPPEPTVPPQPLPQAPVLEPGRQPDEAYARALSPWRYAVRRVLLRSLGWESPLLARLQGKVRRGWLDTYMVYTSTLGTHTFFMVVLPVFFYFGAPREGRGLLNVLAFGVWAAGIIKDSLCVPRPFAPPVTRLTIGTHHLEYGFPSTHSTNSVSIALYLLSWVRALSASDLLSSAASTALLALLALYAFSVVSGRLYCGMHSMVDCAGGVLLGAALWWTQVTYFDQIEAFLATPGWLVPLTVVPTCLYLVHTHVEPVEDNPAFEDAIAFLSVVMGCALGRWTAVRWGFDPESGFFEPKHWEGAVWCGVAVAKLVLGISLIFMWRLLAKAAMHAILPPLFRLLWTLHPLPNRRNYTPATVYQHYSPRTTADLNPVPSVIDLPSHLSHMSDSSASSEIRQRRNGTGTAKAEEAGRRQEDVPEAGEEGAEVRHYDADVLTKVVVYAGIGFLAAEATPWLFEWLGLGVY